MAQVEEVAGSRSGIEEIEDLLQRLPPNLRRGSILCNLRIERLKVLVVDSSSLSDNRRRSPTIAAALYGSLSSSCSARHERGSYRRFVKQKREKLMLSNRSLEFNERCLLLVAINQRLPPLQCEPSLLQHCKLQISLHLKSEATGNTAVQIEKIMKPQHTEAKCITRLSCNIMKSMSCPGYFALKFGL